MKLLHVITSMNPLTGGPCQGIRNINADIIKHGVEREIVCLDDPESSFLGNDSLKIHALGPTISPWCYTRKLIPWLKENLERFDVVIVNGIWLFSSYATWKSIELLKKDYPKKKLPQIFIMPHGMLDPWFQNEKTRKWKALRNKVYWKLIEHKVINDANGLLFTCELEKKLAREPFKPYKPKREINIGYGIQTPPIYSDIMTKAFLEKCPGLTDKNYFLFLSRIHYKKGVELLINAYSRLLQNSQDRTAIPKLVIAGPGLETPYGQKMYHLVINNPLLKNQVFFTGMLFGNEKWGALYGCEAFVLPSHQENFGIAVAEALACKKTVLISNQVNIYREIESTGSGLIASDTVDGVYKLLTDWLCLPTQQKQLMNEKARLTFESLFTTSGVAKRLYEVLTTG